MELGIEPVWSIGRRESCEQKYACPGGRIVQTPDSNNRCGYKYWDEYGNTQRHGECEWGVDDGVVRLWNGHRDVYQFVDHQNSKRHEHNGCRYWHYRTDGGDKLLQQDCG